MDNVEEKKLQAQSLKNCMSDLSSLVDDFYKAYKNDEKENVERILFDIQKKRITLGHAFTALFTAVPRQL